MLKSVLAFIVVLSLAGPAFTEDVGPFSAKTIMPGCRTLPMSDTYVSGFCGYFSGWWRARFNTAWARPPECRSRILVASFRDRPQFVFATSQLSAVDPDPGCKVTTRSKNLRVRDSGGDGGRAHNANPSPLSD